MTRQFEIQQQPLTLAEVCEAIVSGRVPTQVEDGYYKVSRRALLRLLTMAEGRKRPSRRQPSKLAS